MSSHVRSRSSFAMIIATPGFSHSGCSRTRSSYSRRFERKYANASLESDDLIVRFAIMSLISKKWDAVTVGGEFVGHVVELKHDRSRRRDRVALFHISARVRPSQVSDDFAVQRKRPRCGARGRNAHGPQIRCAGGRKVWLQ